MSIAPPSDVTDKENWSLIRGGLAVDASSNRAFVALRRWQTPGIAIVDLAAASADAVENDFVVISVENKKHLLPEYVGGIFLERQTGKTAAAVWIAIATKPAIVVRVDLATREQQLVEVGALTKNRDDFSIEVGGSDDDEDEFFFVGLAGWFAPASAVVKMSTKTRKRVGICEVPLPGSAPGSFTFPSSRRRRGGSNYFFAVTMHIQTAPEILVFDSNAFLPQSSTAAAGGTATTPLLCLVQRFVLSNVYQSDVKNKLAPTSPTGGFVHQPGIAHSLALSGDGRNLFAMLRTSPATIIRVNVAVKEDENEKQDSPLFFSSPLMDGAENNNNYNATSWNAKFTFPAVAPLQGRVIDPCSAVASSSGDSTVVIATCSLYRSDYDVPATAVQLNTTAVFDHNETTSPVEGAFRRVVLSGGAEVVTEFSWAVIKLLGAANYVVASGDVKFGQVEISLLGTKDDAPEKSRSENGDL